MIFDRSRKRQQSQMTSQDNPYPVVTRVIEVFGDWLRHRRDLHEMQELGQSDAGEFARIADELGVSAAELDTFVRRGAHAADEMPQLLLALGIDEAALARAEPRMVTDLQRICALCGHKRRCHRELAAGTAADHYPEFCDNAAMIDSLRPRAG
jgi:hypothetical protein